MNGALEASIPAEELVLGGGAPQYDREYKRPSYFDEIEKFNISSIDDADNLKSIAEKIISLPSIASKKWIYTQYDSMVGTGNTSTNSPSDAAVVLVKGTSKGIAMTTDCNSRYVYADPTKGAMIAVSEAARNIVCSGGEPLGVTNCLNFGNPYDPEVYYQFVGAIKGMGDACRKFDTPVTGGNVSFYNQNPDGPVNPTPTIGMVGLLSNVANKMTLDFKAAGDEIYLLGESYNDIGCSQYLHEIKGLKYSSVPHFDIDEEFSLQQLVKKLIADKLIQSAHDISEGGLITTLLEKGFSCGLGFDVQSGLQNSKGESIRKDAYWFGEAQSRVVVSVSPEKKQEFLKLISALGGLVSKLGEVTKGEVKVGGENWGEISKWKGLYENSLEGYLGK
jgi:phosphoribosylformylglycinamidine synthase